MRSLTGMRKGKKLGYRYIAKNKNKKEGEEEMDTIGIANFDDVQNESE